MLCALGIAAAFFAAVGPTLDWLEFSNGIENLNVETALEMRRGGPWIIPTLMGEPRVRKPPLCAWITAWGIDPQVVQTMSSLDTAAREDAWKQLAWQARWPALLAASLTLALAYELGYTLLGHTVGLTGALAAASSLLFLRYARSAATDVHLALWVTAANLCLVKLIFERRAWLGCLGAGAALGMGMMSKGPVTFVMTLVPAIVFLTWRAAVGRDFRVRVPILPLVLGVMLAAAVGLSWFVYALQSHPGEQRIWWMEILRTDPTEEATNEWFDYIKILGLMVPWTGIFIVGIWLSAAATLRATFGRIEPEQRQRLLRLVYAGTMLVMPIVVMSFFRDRKPRYLYPFAIPAGLLTAYALIGLYRVRGRLWSAILGIHWLVLGVLSVGLPIIGMLGVLGRVQVDGSPWYGRSLGIAAAIVAAGAVAGLIWLARRSPLACVAGTAAVMLGLYALQIHGSRHAVRGDGAAEMLPVARLLWQSHPEAIPYDVHGLKKIPPDLAIYLNRPILKVSSVGAIPRGSRPQMYVDRQKKGQPEPAPAEGFRKFAKVPRDQDWWIAFVREAE